MTKSLQAGEEFVVGFLFSANRDCVLLIHKERPDWQRGKLNGIGGRIEGSETPAEAMRREFAEEAGIDVESWTRYAVLGDGRGWKIHFFHAADRDAFWEAAAQTDEQLARCDVKRIGEEKLIPNLTWLIPMALSMEQETITEFVVQEVK